jgi:hypothetical protein
MIKRWKFALMGLTATFFVCITSCLAMGAVVAWATGLIGGDGEALQLIP